MQKSNRHHADFLFYFDSIDHHDRIPGAAVEEATVRPFAEALLAADAKYGIDLNSAERRVVFVRNPEHAIFYRTILHASRRPSATSAALRNDRQLFRFLFSRSEKPLGLGFKLKLVGHHSGGFQGVCFSRHATDYTVARRIFIHTEDHGRANSMRSRDPSSRSKRRGASG
jgi:hypothetical protein